MKAILEFDLSDPDERQEHEWAINGRKYSMFVFEYFNNVLRPLYKHGIPDNLKDGDVLLQRLRDKFLETLHDNDLKTE